MKITVVIPFYNNSDSIIRAINSVISQSYKPFEIILIDDFSLDNTSLVVLSQLSNFNFNNIFLITNLQNQGPGYSRNIGIDNASGDYIAFLDADDTWHNLKLELQVSAINHFGLDFIGGVKHYPGKNKYSHSIDLEFFFKSLLPINLNKLVFNNKFATSSVLVIKSRFLRFNIESFAEDYNLWIILAGYDFKMMSSSIPLCYQNHPNNYLKGLSSKLIDMEVGEIKAIFYSNSDPAIKSIAILFSAFKFLVRFFWKHFRL